MIDRRTFLATGVVAATASFSASAARIVQTPRANGPAPWGALPSKRQLRWHRWEQYAFVHFAMNTFTDKEWGYGDEDPRKFDPSDFSPDQIVAAAKAGNLKGLIFTAKHHDGFCLWPTRLTEHCIRNSPYRDGKGDIVGEMAAACRRAGLAFGIYLSPWDRNHAEYGRPGYLDYFRKQIVELCTRYGDLFEFWFDGANGGDGYYGGARESRKIDAPAYYNWPRMIELVHQHQPMACTFDPLGADIRWGGNEDGIAGDPSWPTMPNAPYTQENGNSGVRGGALWWPAETNTSIRPGWFYHADEDGKVRSPENLVRYFDTSVARGTNMNLNLPPDRRGRIPDHDVAVLKSFGDAIRASFAIDLAKASQCQRIAWPWVRAGARPRPPAGHLLVLTRHCHHADADVGIVGGAQLRPDPPARVFAAGRACHPLRGRSRDRWAVASAGRSAVHRCTAHRAAGSPGGRTSRAPGGA